MSVHGQELLKVLYGSDSRGKQLSTWCGDRERGGEGGVRDYWSDSSVSGGTGASKYFSMALCERSRVFSDGKAIPRAAIVATGLSGFSRKRGYSWVVPGGKGRSR